MSDNNFDTDIAVVGMAGRFAGARNIAEFWNNLRDGVESLTRFTEAELLAAGVDPAELADPNYVPVGAVMPDMESFDAKFFGFSPREASIMDPQHRHFLEVSWEALENAGHVPASFQGSIGVFGGSGHNAYMPYNLMSNPQLMRQVGFFLVRHTGNDKDFLTTRVSYLLNLKGPSVNVQTACSTSLVAIHLGVQSLLNRECDMALAGGVTIEMPHRHGYLYRESEILSPDGHCHAFDANSQGTVFGSGAGVVVLRRLGDAIQDGDHIHAVIKGSAVNNDGALKVGYMAPSVDGQAQAIAEALAVADVDADTITYVEAHGTGTPVGDPIEIAALTQAFRQSTDKVGFCGIGSVKSNIGHTDTAAGVANFLKVALAMQHQQLPPSLFFQANNPACEFERSPFYVNDHLKAWIPPTGVPRRAGISSLGVGGTNAHVVMQEAPKREASSTSRPWQLLVQSARTLTALDNGSAALAKHFQATRAAHTTFADAAHTLRFGRQAMKQRRVVVARDADDAAQALQAKDATRVFTDVASDDPRSVAFMFAGGGAQHPNMGLDLHRDEPVFRATLEQALAFCETKLNRPLRAVLFPAAGQEAQAAKQLEQPSLALPALLAVQVAQARLLMSWGIQPAAMIGHSMGEYTAAHVAGVFSLEDALTLVELRGRLFESLPEGAMLSVPLGEEALRAWMTPELSISVVNAPNMTVVGGPVAAIEALQAKLAAQEIEAARVRINVAAHSSMLEPILQPFAAVFQRIALKAPTVPFVSNLSGTWITPLEATDPAYWVNHLRNTVRFADGVQTLLQDESRVLLEVGPGRTLSSLARQHPARKTQQPVINSMRHPDEVVNDQAHALTVLGRLWAVGVDVPWAQLQGQERRLRVPLPTYAFDHARHWVEPGRGVHALPASERSLHKRKDLTAWFYQPSWQAQSVAVTASSSTEPNATKDRTLVFADHHGVADATVATLRARGTDVVVVRQGKTFKRIDALSYTVVPGLVADMDRLVEALTADDRVPSRILHAWCITRSDPLPAGVAGVTAMRRLGFDSLLSLAQAMGREDWSDPLQLLVLCDGLQRVAGEGAHMPAKALLLGPTSVIPREFSNVRCALMDIDAPALGSRPAHRLNEGILAELGGDLLDPVVAWRGGQRWVQGYTAKPLAQPTVSKLRQRGVYLITGGLGGVGLALASHLANTVQARLVLLGRTALPPRDQWERIAADHHTATSMAQRLQQLMALERAGADVMVVAADVTNVAQMQTVLKQVRERFGDINGVLHTAGVLNDGVMQLKEAQAASAVFAPKVDGTLALEAALHSVQVSSAGNASPLDFIVLFSSISAFAGLAGQVDYAAANAYLDAYAQERFQRDGTPVIAINWSQWQEVGMAAALAQSLGIEPAALPSQATSDDTPSGQTIGHPFVDRLLRSTPNEQLFETRFSRDTHWLLEEHRVQGGEALIPGTGYLEIVRTAFAHAQALGAGQAVSLRKVTFLAPFAVMPGQARDLRVRFQPHQSGPNVFAFTVTGQPADVDAAAPWVEHVRGLVSVVTPTVLQASPPDAIVQRCTERLQQRSTAPVHLHFGPRWRNVTLVHHGRGEALMRLDLPQVYAADLATFPLHPAMMDLATAGAQSLLPGFDESRDFFVPASYEQITVHAALTSPCFSHIRARLDDATLADNGDDLATFDVTITDSTGHILVDVNGFTMIRVRDKALLAVGAAHAPATSVSLAPVNDAHAATPALKPRATANTILASGMRDGMLSSEGAAVLERVLAWGAGPQIIVSPQDLHGLLAQWHAPPARSISTQDNGHPDGQADGEANPGARAPVTPTEQLIAQMWGEMLGHHRVAATDNFFDLGGHSLLAVQVINKLKKRTGKALPLTALLEAPTVEELAALIEPPGTLEAALAGGGAQAGTQAAQASATSASKAAPLGVKRDGVVNRTLIPIRKGEGRPPLFLVHDGNGETLLYRTLAHKLDPQHPVYGLQPAQRADASFVDTSITAMATAHIEQLRSVQPQGPYFIAGLCAGGVVAHEMALQLQQAGERTAYLGLMDAADVAAPSRGYENSQRWQRFLSTLDGDASTPMLLRVAKALPTMAKKVVGALRYQVAYRLERRRLAKGIGEWQGDAVAAPSVAPISFLEMYELAHLKHQPQGVVQSGEAVLYRAKQGTGDDADVPFIQRYADDSLGWQPRFSAGVKVTEVPGGHASLLQEPNVQTLAVAVQRDIDQALTANAKRPSGGDGPDGGAARTMPPTSLNAAPSTAPHGASQRAAEPLESP